MINFIERILRAELAYLQRDWWILALAIITAAGIKVYVGQEKIRAWMQGKTHLSITGSVGFGAFTPLCSCGTMAVIISMFVTALPWGPVMAFLVSSPLTSPSQFIFQSGILGFDFALAVLISSVLMGLIAGFLAAFLEKHTVFFKNQFRIRTNQNCSEENCGQVNADEHLIDAYEETCCSTDSKAESFMRKLKIKDLIYEVYELGVKKILLYFIIFIAIGQLIEIFIPSEWILELFNSGKIYSIPLAALIGLPLYVSGSASLPLLKSLLDIGAGGGAILAFLISGQATSIAVILGISTFIKKRALGFYISFVFLGAIISGFVYQLII